MRSVAHNVWSIIGKLRSFFWFDYAKSTFLKRVSVLCQVTYWTTRVTHFALLRLTWWVLSHFVTCDRHRRRKQADTSVLVCFALWGGGCLCPLPPTLGWGNDPDAKLLAFITQWGHLFATPVQSPPTAQPPLHDAHNISLHTRDSSCLRDCLLVLVLFLDSWSDKDQMMSMCVNNWLQLSCYW